MSDQKTEPSPCTSILTAAEFEDAIASVMPKLCAFARRLTGNTAESEDLVQDTLLRAWRARVAFQPGTNLKAWLFRIQRNSFLTRVRRARLWVDLDALAADALLAEQPKQEVYLAEVDLQRALTALPPHHRAAVLSVSAGKSYNEAAEALDISIGTLKSRLARARAVLRGRDQIEHAVAPLEAPPAERRPATPPLPERPRQPGRTYEAWKRSGSKMIG